MLSTIVYGARDTILPLYKGPTQVEGPFIVLFRSSYMTRIKGHKTIEYARDDALWLARAEGVGEIEHLL